MDGIIPYSLLLKLSKEVKSIESGIDSIEVNGTKLIFHTTSGDTLEMTFPQPENGAAITNVEVTDDVHIICTLSNGETIDAGEIPLPEVKLSKQDDNILIQKPDGLYAKQFRVNSTSDGNVPIIDSIGNVIDSNINIEEIVTKDILDTITSTKSYTIVDVLPESSEETSGFFYLVKNTGTTTTYDQYVTVVVNGVYDWYSLGSINDVDLINYVTKDTTIAGLDLSDNITKAELLLALGVAENANNIDIDTETDSITDGYKHINNIWTKQTLTRATQEEVYETLGMEPPTPPGPSVEDYIPIQASIGETIGGTIE